MIRMKLGNITLLTAKQEDADRFCAMTEFWSKKTQEEFFNKCFQFTLKVFASANKPFNGELFVPTEIIDWLAEQPIARVPKLSSNNRRIINQQIHHHNMVSINNFHQQLFRF